MGYERVDCMLKLSPYHTAPLPNHDTYIGPSHSWASLGRKTTVFHKTWDWAAVARRVLQALHHYFLNPELSEF